MEYLLAERGLLPAAGLRAACANEAAHSPDGNCCCKRMLGKQLDFKYEISALQRTVEKGEHLCLFLPKYHCELNWIERYWEKC